MLGSVTTTNETNQTRTIDSLYTVLTDVKAFIESGDLYDGDYSQHEWTTDSSFSSSSTETNTFTGGADVTTTTTNGSVFVDRSDEGNRKEGDFETGEDMTTTTLVTIENTNQTRMSHIVVSATTLDHDEKSGNSRSGSYEYEGFHTVLASTASGVASNGPQTTTTSSVVDQDFTSWTGGGDVLSGAFTRIVDDSRRRITSTELIMNQGMSDTSTSVSKSESQGMRTGNLVSGTYHDESTTTTEVMVTGLLTQATLRIESRADASTDSHSDESGNIFTGDYSLVTSSSSDSSTDEVQTNQTLRIDSRRKSNSSTTSNTTGNHITGLYDSDRHVVSQDDAEESMSNQLRSGTSSMISQSTSDYSGSGNTIVGASFDSGTAQLLIPNRFEESGQASPSRFLATWK